MRGRLLQDPHEADLFEGYLAGHHPTGFEVLDLMTNDRSPPSFPAQASQIWPKHPDSIENWPSIRRLVFPISRLRAQLSGDSLDETSGRMLLGHLQYVAPALDEALKRKPLRGHEPDPLLHEVERGDLVALAIANADAELAARRIAAADTNNPLSRELAATATAAAEQYERFKEEILGGGH